MQGQRNGGPLVLFDAAIVMGLEEALLGILKEGPGLEIQTGAIDMRYTDADAFRYAAAADGGSNERLAAVIEVDLIPCFILLGVIEGNVAGLFQQGNGSQNRLVLGLGGIEEGLVAFAEIIRRLEFFFGHGFGEILWVHQQLFTQLFALVFFAHGYLLLLGFHLHLARCLFIGTKNGGSAPPLFPGGQDPTNL